MRSLPRLRLKPLEECDALAKQVGTAAQAMATAAGAATGAGGPLATLADVPLLFTMALRTILKIGHCYGYPLDQRRDRPFVVGILITAISGSLETRRQRLGQIRELEDLLLEETQEEILAEEALTFLFQLEEFEEVPGVGAISGTLLNLAFMHRIDVTARRIFQERWLRDSGKTGEMRRRGRTTPARDRLDRRTRTCRVFGVLLRQFRSDLSDLDGGLVVSSDE